MESEVTVTHFINPHLFWFKTIGADDPEHDHVLSMLEKNLEQLYKNKPSCDNQLRPQIGDKVAVNFIARNKFIRAEVLQKAEFQQEEYIVWAFDYGFPLLTKKDYLRHLPTNLREDFGRIRVGGIANIYPAEQEYDDEEGNLILVKKDKWLQRTCNMLEKLLMDATSISFVLHFQQTSKCHNWGDLIVVNHRGNKINALDFLLKTTTAIKAEDYIIFQEKCCKLNTTKIAPWLSNDRNTKVKFNTIKHNYVEHSQQMVATIIDEQAKRKVEDWQKRNEIGAIDEFTEVLEQPCVEADNNAHVDDVTFDDSVSVVQEQNYMGKAGAITKNKRKTHFANKDLSASVLQKAFQMDDIEPSARNLNKFPQPSESSLSTNVNNFPQPSESSLSTNISNRMQKLALLRKSSAKNKQREKLVMASENSPPQSYAFEPNESSSISSKSVRHQKLMEMRRKTANKNIEKNNSSTVNQNLCATESTTKTLDSFSYHLLEQSTTLSNPNQSTIEHTKENKSELSIKNIGLKHLGAMRKKYDTSATTSINSETESSVEKVKPQDTLKVKGNEILSNNKDFELKSKAFSKIEDSTVQFNDISLPEGCATVQKKTLHDKLKIDQSGYDGLNIVPAGYDITRLCAYKDEKNHWHRKKTTRFDSLAHDSTTSSEDCQYSSDFVQTPPSAKLTLTSTNHSDENSSLKNKNTEVSKCSKQYDASETSKNQINIGKNVISSKMSA